MSALTPARWAQLSPLLDELLDLDAAARALRLAALRTTDATLADDLQALLAREAADFLARPAAASVLAADTLSAGQTLGAYTLEREIGQGGMGSVWLARRTDGRFEGQVAIKFLKPGLLNHPGGGSGRFAREGQILARLAHPNIARLLDAGVAADGGPPYLVLEYVDGQPITRYCEQQALSVQQRVQLFLAVLAAVAHAHNRLILHRDLKPSNILVTTAGEVKLLDFGIAKLIDESPELTQQVGGAFTPQYAAPEQVQGGDVTTATDVYSLGVLLYLILSGQHPTALAVTEGSALARMQAVVEHEPKRLSEQVSGEQAKDLRGDLDTIVAKALKKKPAERYANAEQLAADLRRWLAHEPVSARPDSAWYRGAMFLRRHRLGASASLGVVLALGLGLGVAVHEGREAQHQRDQAEGLIEFMLGDLRKKLEPVGRLDVMDAVGDKALGYYSEQQLAGMDASSLGRRARALHLMGEIAEKRGKLDEAGRLFRQAAASTGELLERHPKNGAVVFEHAQSVYWVGFIARRLGQAAEAQAQFQRYLDLSIQLTLLDPGHLDWQTEKAFAQQNLGVLQLETGHSVQALDSFRRTRETWLGLVPHRPELNLELANTLGWIANAEEDLGEFSRALAANQAKIKALQQQVDASTNREVQVLQANALHEVGRMQLSLGQLAQARASAREAVAQLMAIFATDVANMSWLRQLYVARLGLAEMLSAQADKAAHGPLLAQLGQDMDRLRGSGNELVLLTLQGRLNLQQAQAAASPDAIGSLQSFIKRMDQLQAGGAVLNAEQLRVTASAELLLGELLATVPASARDAPKLWNASIQRLASSKEKPSRHALTLIAHAKFRLGFTAEAQTMADMVEASEFRHPDYLALKNLLKPRQSPSNL